MKRIIAAVLFAAIVGMTMADTKASGWGIPGSPELASAKPQQAPMGPVGDRYGFNPMLRHMMWWKKDRCSPCENGGCGGPGGMGGYGMPGMGGAGMGGGGGTMVFPSHPYVRSPRDWFQN